MSKPIDPNEVVQRMQRLDPKWHRILTATLLRVDADVMEQLPAEKRGEVFRMALAILGVYERMLEESDTDNKHLTDNLTAVQTRCTELLEQTRRLTSENAGLAMRANAAERERDSLRQQREAKL